MGPSRLGKYTTVFQAVAVLGCLRAALVYERSPEPLVRTILVLTFVLTLVGGIQYAGRAVRQLRQADSSSSHPEVV